MTINRPIVGIVCAALALAVCGCGHADDATPGGGLRIRSPAFAANAAIPVRYSCQGKAQSPPLKWQNVPDNAKSLAIIVDDPDAPSGVWVHWVLYNLPANTRRLTANADAGSLPVGTQHGENSWHKAAYGGMCPPSGSHRYRFKLYALDTKLTLKKPDKATLLDAMQGHIIGKARLTATYRKH